MPTPIFVCGAECNIAAVGTVSTPGVEHWSGTSAPSIVTSGPSSMRSARCFRNNPGGFSVYLEHTFTTAIGSGGTGVARFYVNFATLPGQGCELIHFRGTTSGTLMGPYFDPTDNTIKAGIGGALGASGVSVTTGQWYRVDVKVVWAATHTCDVQVDGVACGQKTQAIAAEGCSLFRIGNFASISSGDWYTDDVIVSATSADYPIGAGTIVGLDPRADGTHGGGWATGTFGKSTSGATNASNTDTDIWQSLDNPLVTTAAGAWVSDLTGTVTTSYVEFLSDAMPADTGTINGAMVVFTCHCASTTASNHSLNLADGTNSVSLLSGALNVSTITVPVIVRNTDASGVAWTKTTLNALKTRFASTDSNPDVYLDGYCWEVDYVQLATGKSPPIPPPARGAMHPPLLRTR